MFINVITKYLLSIQCSVNSGDGIDYHQRFSENIGDLIEVNIGEHWQTLANIIYYIFQNRCYLTWQMTNVDVMFQSRATLVTVEKTQKTRFLLILSTSDNSLGSKYEGSELTSWDNKLWWHSSTMSVVGNIKGQLKACSDNIKGQRKESLFRQKISKGSRVGQDQTRFSPTISYYLFIWYYSFQQCEIFEIIGWF